MYALYDTAQSLHTMQHFGPFSPTWKLANVCLLQHQMYDLPHLLVQLKISFSVHRDLNVKGQNDKSMDYTIAAGAPALAYPPAPGAAPVGAAPPGRPPTAAPANGSASYGKLICVQQYWPSSSVAACWQYCLSIPACNPNASFICLMSLICFDDLLKCNVLVLTYTQ